MMKEIRKLIAVKLLNIAIDIIPDERFKIAYCKFIAENIVNL